MFRYFVPTYQAAEHLKGYTTPDAYFDRAYQRFREELQLNSADIRQIYTFHDIEENLKENRISAMLTVEDVSHLNEGGFWDVARYSKAPFIASHSCARGLCDVSRNLTDVQLRAVAESGGVIGVNYYTRFVRPMKNEQDLHTSIEDITRQLVYMRNVAGIDALALGSDYDGMECTMEWKDC